MDNDTVILFTVLAFFILFGFSLYLMLDKMPQKRVEKPVEPAPVADRCEVTIELGWPLAMPTQCWRKRGHEQFGAKHYTKKGDGTNFIAEW